MTNQITKAETIRYLASERCSVPEIALAVGRKERCIKEFLRYGMWPKTYYNMLHRSGVMKKSEFNSWRGWQIGNKVISL